MKKLPLVPVTIGDYVFHLHDDGKGLPLLFVHGSVADLTSFTGSIAHLRPTFRCIAYSRRFHPPNKPPAPGDQYDTAAQAEEMLKIIDATGAGPVVMVGSSFGAYIGLIAALKSPRHFRGLVLCEPPMVPLLLRHPDGRALHDDFVNNVIAKSRKQFQAGQDEEALKTFVEGIRGEAGWFDRLFPPIRQDLLRFTPELRCEFLSQYERYMVDITPDALQSVHLPTLLLGGQLSRPLFRAVLDVLAGSIPGALRREIPRAGHLLHLQNADAFENAVKEFARDYLG